MQTKPSVLDEIDINNIKWTKTVPRSSDQLMGEYLVLSSPCERGWHSCTLMNRGKLLVVYGGYRYKYDAYVCVHVCVYFASVLCDIARSRLRRPSVPTGRAAARPHST